MKINSVLVIDDSEADQFLSKVILKKFNSEITLHQAFDGAEGLKILAELETEPDLIFLDINMPGMDGFGFLEKYSESKDHVSVVVMLTSSSQDKDKERAAQYDCVKTYLEKPLDLDDLAVLAEMDI